MLSPPLPTFIVKFTTMTTYVSTVQEEVVYLELHYYQLKETDESSLESLFSFAFFPFFALNLWETSRCEQCQRK